MITMTKYRNAALSPFSHLVSTRMLVAAATSFLGLVAAPVWAQQNADSDGDGVINSIDPFPCSADISTLLAVPAQNAYSTIYFEDQWPAGGDFDFNDVVLDYNTEVYSNASGVKQIRLTYFPRAYGALFNNGAAVRLPNISPQNISSISRKVGANAPTTVTAVAGESDAVIKIADDIRAELFAGAAGQINTIDGQATQSGKPVEITITFATPVAANTINNALAASPSFDLFIFRTGDFGHQIHQPSFGGTQNMRVSLRGTQDDRSANGRFFVNAQGIPFALSLPTSAKFAKEGVRIDSLFPNIVPFAQSGGVNNTDFFSNGVQNSFASGLIVSNAPQITAVSNDQSCVFPDHDLDLWLDATDITADQLLCSVTNWADKRGSAANTAITLDGTTAPVIAASAINGKSVVRFDGASNGLKALSTLTGNPNFTVIAVVQNRADIISGYRGWFGWGTAATAQSVYWGPGRTGGEYYYGFFGGGTVVSGVAPTVSTPELHTWRRTGGNTSSVGNEGFINGVAKTLVNDGTLPSPNATVNLVVPNRSRGYTIGFTNNGAWRGDVAEILVYKRKLTESERGQVEGYLQKKWFAANNGASETNPLQSDLDLWLDASDRDTMVTQCVSAVAVWPDRSGRNNHATPVSSGPTLVANASPNALPMVQFANTGGMQTALSSVLAGNPNFTVFAVSTVNSLAGSNSHRGWLGWGTSSAGKSVYFSPNGDATRYYYGFFSGGNIINGVTANTNIHVHTWRRTGGTNNASTGNEGFLDGVSQIMVPDATLVANAGVVNLTATPYTIGFTNNGTMNGNIGEILVYTRALSDSERISVEQYLLDKWVR